MSEPGRQSYQQTVESPCAIINEDQKGREKNQCDRLTSARASTTFSLF